MNDPFELLRKVEILSSLSPDETRLVLDSARSVTLDSGSLLFREGDRGRELFIVESGEIAISIHLPDGVEKEIDVVREGDFFGEMSIFDDEPRSATCTAKTPARLIALNRDEFFRVIEKHPDAAVKILYRMLTITTRRLRNTGEFVADTVRWGEEARRRVITDELTGVFNRRYLDEALAEQFRIAKAGNRPLSIIMADLDHFSEINEKCGRGRGDELIMDAVRIFKRRLRSGDIISRYGGDEFTVMMPGTAMDEAREVAQRICDDVAQLTVVPAGEGRPFAVTASQGIASFPECAGTLEELRSLADSALYRAKEEGRNRVVCAGR